MTYTWMAVALVLLGFILRVIGLESKDIWVDEALVWSFARLPLLESLVKGFAVGPINSNSDPLYNIFLHAWLPLTGDSLFALRLFSVLANVMTVAYLSRVTRRWFGANAGLAAMLIGVIAPLWVFYSQEVRPYAFTPALMLIVLDAVFALSTGQAGRHTWTQLVLGEALSLYAHGFMVFGIAGANLWLIWLWVRRYLDYRSSLFSLREWIISRVALLVVMILSIPNYFARAGGFRNPFVPRLTFSEYVNEMALFFMGIPWEHVLDAMPLRLIASVALVLAGIGLALVFRAGKNRHLADLVWLVALIMGLTAIYAWIDPSVHPRYVVFMTGPAYVILSAVMGRLMSAGVLQRWAGIALGLCLFLTAWNGNDNLYSGRYRGYRHPSTRAVTDTLKTELGANDGIVVINAHDFTLEYYGVGSAPVQFARFDDGIEDPHDLIQFMQGKQKIGILRDTNERSDTRRIAAFYAERYGTLIEKRYFEGYDLSVYQLDESKVPELAMPAPVDVTWGDIGFSGASLASGDGVTVQLHWVAQTSLPLNKRLAASIRLIDPVTRWEIAGTDALLLDSRGNPTDHWGAESQTDQYFTVPLPPGVPPLSAEIVITVYDEATGKVLDILDEAGAPSGQQAKIGAVTLGPAPARWVYDDTLRLWSLQPIESPVARGYSLDKAVIAPGSRLGVTVGWIIPFSEVNQRARIQVVQDGLVIAEEAGPVLQGRPAADVKAGEMWLDHRVLTISADAHTGTASVQVVMGNETVLLTEVEVAGFERLTERPTIPNILEATFGTDIRLLGYQIDAPSPITSNSTITLTLYWEALADGAPDANLKVFTQILAEDGHLVGQHDAMPDFDRRPFSGWLIGEYVIDVHPLIFVESYAGPIHFQIGLYDPVTFARVLTDSGSDSVVLPERFVVESNP